MTGPGFYSISSLRLFPSAGRDREVVVLDLVPEIRDHWGRVRDAFAPGVGAPGALEGHALLDTGFWPRNGDVDVENRGIWVEVEPRWGMVEAAAEVRHRSLQHIQHMACVG